MRPLTEAEEVQSARRFPELTFPWGRSAPWSPLGSAASLGSSAIAPAATGQMAVRRAPVPHSTRSCHHEKTAANPHHSDDFLFGSSRPDARGQAGQHCPAGESLGVEHASAVSAGRRQRQPHGYAVEHRPRARPTASGCNSTGTRRKTSAASCCTPRALDADRSTCRSSATGIGRRWATAARPKRRRRFTRSSPSSRSERSPSASCSTAARPTTKSRSTTTRRRWPGPWPSISRRAFSWRAICAGI